MAYISIFHHKHGVSVAIIDEDATEYWKREDGHDPSNEKEYLDEGYLPPVYAAAPELLAALKAIKHDLLALDSGDVWNGVDGWRHMDATFVDQLISGSFRVAKDAINKAEGRAE